MTSTTTRSRPPRRVAVIGAALVIYLGTAALFVAVASSMLGVSRRGGGALFGERIAIVELEGLIVDVDDQVRERSEEHTSELQSPCNLVCRLLLEKKKKKKSKV